jgi:hypothetical protein
MNSRALNPLPSKALWSGLLFLAIGVAGLIFGWGLPRGRASHMGPGFFPMILCSVLCCIGFINIAKSFLADDERVEPIRIVRIATALSGVVLFGLLIQYAGLGLAAFALVAVSAAAATDRRWRDVALLAMGLSLASIAVFILGLGLPLRIWF